MDDLPVEPIGVDFALLVGLDVQPYSLVPPPHVKGRLNLGNADTGLGLTGVSARSVDTERIAQEAHHAIALAGRQRVRFALSEDENIIECFKHAEVAGMAIRDGSATIRRLQRSGPVCLCPNRCGAGRIAARSAARSWSAPRRRVSAPAPASVAQASSEPAKDRCTFDELAELLADQLAVGKKHLIRRRPVQAVADGSAALRLRADGAATFLTLRLPTAASDRPAAACFPRGALDRLTRLVHAIRDELPNRFRAALRISALSRSIPCFTCLPSLRFSSPSPSSSVVTPTAPRRCARCKITRPNSNGRSGFAQCLPPKAPGVDVKEFLQFRGVNGEKAAFDQEPDELSLAASSAADIAPLASALSARLVLRRATLVLLLINAGGKNAGRQVDLSAISVHPCAPNRVRANVEA